MIAPDALVRRALSLSDPRRSYWLSAGGTVRDQVDEANHFIYQTLGYRVRAFVSVALVRVVLVIQLTQFVTGCASFTTTGSSASNPSQTKSTITIVGPSEVRIGDSASFRASVVGTKGPFRWSVNGVAGGNSQVGTIGPDGGYTPPASVGQFTIQCSIPSGQTAQTTIDVLNPVPGVAAAAEMGAEADGVLIDITGSGFVSQSEILLGTGAVPTSFVSSTELHALLPLSTMTGQTVALSVGNPQPGASTSNVVNIAITKMAALPTLSIGSGNFTSTQVLSMSTGTPNATIYYTTDGSIPNDSSEIYSSPILLTSTQTIKAIAAAPLLSPSAVAEASYTLPSGLVQLPSPVHLVLGCSNPNTGTPTGDWGATSSAFPGMQAGFYIPVSKPAGYQGPDTSQISIGYPAYNSNSIFSVSIEAKAGQAVSLTGAFTGASKTVTVAAIPTGTTDWRSMVDASTEVASVVQQGTTSAYFVIPESLPSGVVGFRINDPTAPPVYGLANTPSITWFAGVPSTNAIDQALLSQVHSCAAEPGEILRLFGSDFTELSTAHVILQAQSGADYDLAPVALDSNSMSVKIPDSIDAGTYMLWIGNQPWDAASSRISLITVVPPPSLSSVDAPNCPLNTTGKVDISSVLQACLDADAPTDKSQTVVRLRIPAGSFLMSGGVTIHPYEVLIGDSQTTSNFIYQPQAQTPMFTVTRYAGLENLSATGLSNSTILGSVDAKGHPNSTGHYLINKVTISSSGQAGPAPLVTLQGPDVQVYDSTISSGASTSMDASNFLLRYGDGAELSGNAFDDTNSYNGIGSSQNVIIERNQVYSDIGPSPKGQAAFQIARAFCAYCNTRSTQNIYLGNNSFSNMGESNSASGAPTNQIVLTDGGAGAYFGYIQSATRDSVTLAAAPSWVWTGTTNPRVIMAVIVSGTGVGQYSFLKGVSGNSGSDQPWTLFMATPWKVVPDTSSIVNVLQVATNWTVSNNEFKDTVGQSLALGGMVNAVVEDNRFIDSGHGIHLIGFLYGGFNPILGVEVLRNSIEFGSGRYIATWPPSAENAQGIGIYGEGGSLISGVMIRDNVLPVDPATGADVQTIFATNGSYLIDGAAIEGNKDEIGNDAIWTGTTYMPCAPCYSIVP